jgi:hypothetical protein
MRQKLGFDETALYYSTFRELLADAEAAGFVQLKCVLGGDVQIAPGEAGTLGSEPTRDAEDGTDDDDRRGERAFIRRDFWQTVVRPGQWWYGDAIVRAASAPSGNDVIKMPDLGDETQGPWVEEFVHTLPRPRQEARSRQRWRPRSTSLARPRCCASSRRPCVTSGSTSFR